MKMIDEKQLYQKALNKWGIDSQILMTIEESSELILVLAKINRNYNGSSIKQIIDEMVDVSIMIEQLKIILNCNEDFEKIKTEKLIRLEFRINNG